MWLCQVRGVLENYRERLAMEFALKKNPKSECKSRLPIREGPRKVVKLLGAFLADRESGRKSKEAVSDGISFNENLKGGICCAWASFVSSIMV